MLLFVFIKCLRFCTTGTTARIPSGVSLPWLSVGERAYPAKNTIEFAGAVQSRRSKQHKQCKPYQDYLFLEITLVT